MHQLRVASASLNQTPLDWQQNAENIAAAIRTAQEEGAQVLCLPELCLSGYGCEDAFLWEGTAQTALEVLAELLPATAGLVVSVGLPLRVEGAVYNAVALLVDGALVGFACKRHLAGEGLHYEPRWFTPWPAGRVAQVTFFGQELPAGDLVFDVGAARLGFEICEDAWVSARPGGELAQAGVNIILNPSASHFAFGKHAQRRGIVLRGAAEFGCVYAYANLLGNEAGRAIYDGDALIAQPSSGGGARIVAETRRLSFRSHQLACANVTLFERTRPEQARGRHVVSTGFSPPSPADRPPVSARTPSAGDDGELSKEQAFARVISLGLFDYLRKSRSEGFVVSLSGGADSAAVALLVRLMVRLGCAELGGSLFREKLAYFIRAPETEEQLVSRLLTTVYQATKNSSEVTRSAALAIAVALGSRHHEISVQTLVDGYSSLVEAALGRPLAWETDDIALQNIQARARAPAVWMLANVSRALLLSTSNRSEAAVGYATMDGDTSGGLSPIAGIDKTFLRHFLVWMQRDGLLESGPVAALSAINAQAPTAELRPPDRSQTDEADLMPYEVLDTIERLAVAQRRPVAAVFGETCARFPELDAEQIKAWVRRFYHLFAINQWKRERYAPSFHVDDANLDPKTWCRFPILSGGFARELMSLDDL